MINQAISLYDWNNGVIMIAVFAFICVALVVVLLLFMFGGKKAEELEEVIEEKLEEKAEATADNEVE